MDRVFHVQTEDSGLKHPVLVTQVFIGGHIVAIEKSSYEDILTEASDEGARDDAIRHKMQDQHKRLLKNLVNHAYDEKITQYVESREAHTVRATEPPASPSPRAPDQEPEVQLPKVQETPAQEAHSVESPEAPPPKASQLDEPDDLFDPIEKGEPESDPSETIRDPNLGTIPTFPAQEVSIHEQATADLLVRPDLQKFRPRPTDVDVPPLRNRAPPAQDTLVDFGLPAALKQQLDEARAALKTQQAAENLPVQHQPRTQPDPRVARFRMPQTSSAPETPHPEIETQIDLELRRRASSARLRATAERSQTTDPSKLPTVPDLSPEQLEDFLKAHAPTAPPTPAPIPASPPLEQENDEMWMEKNDDSWGDAVDEATAASETAKSRKPSIVVVERSLDDVILSYLADDD